MTDSDPPESPVLEGDLIDPVPPPVVEAEIIDADVVDEAPPETVPEYVVVAEPSPDGDDPAPRPFDGPPRVTRRAPTPLPPPDRPAAPPPLLRPVPVPSLSDVDSAASGSRTPGQHRYRPTVAAAPRPARPPAANRRPSPPRRPWLALPLLVLLGLAGAFFAWVSAEPFWLSVGHGEAGTAVVVASASGCRATFVGTTFTKSTVELAGAPGCVVGASMPARMVSSSAGRAYAAGRSGLILRWAVGYTLVLLCGLLVAWMVGGRPRAAAY